MVPDTGYRITARPLRPSSTCRYDRARRPHRPFDVEAARQYGIIAAEVISIGRKPRGRVADFMIASIAAANRLPLFTTNPADFHGLESVVTVVPVPVPV